LKRGLFWPFCSLLAKGEYNHILAVSQCELTVIVACDKGKTRVPEASSLGIRSISSIGALLLIAL
jgi:hypothetical protein